MPSAVFFKDEITEFVTGTVLNTALYLLLAFILQHLPVWTNQFQIPLYKAVLIMAGITAVIVAFLFLASYISWLSYDSLNIELPDGYLHFAPIINWGKYREENGRLMMPVSVRLNHAIADGFLVANVYRLLEKETAAFCGRH